MSENPATLSPPQETVQEENLQPQPHLRAMWETFPSIRDNHDLTQFLEFKSVRLLTWLGRNKSTHYSTLKIRKKNGSTRELHNPDGIMRAVQYRILTKLLEKLKIPDYIYAFEKKKSIPEMAQLHVGKQVVLSVDIKDFFHSIKQSQLHQYFLQLGIGDKAARTLSEICTYKAFVPQGALTSPKVANLVTALTFGPPIKRYCDEHGLTLTIYADDVTISSTNPATNVTEILAMVTGAIREVGFRVNNAKTKVMWMTKRQYVCGVVVNSKTNMIKRERYKLRAIVHNITCNGVEAEARKNNVEPGQFVSHVKGRLNWLKQLNGHLGDKNIAKLDTYLRAYEESNKRTQVAPTTVEEATSAVSPATVSIIGGTQAAAIEAPAPW